MMERKKAIIEAMKKTAEMLGRREYMLINLSRAIEEIEKVSNTLQERLEEWVGMYFDTEKRSAEKFILEQEKPAGEMTEKDLEEMKALAEEIKTLEKLKERYKGYLGEIAKQLCQNISYVAGPDVAAKLIAHVGSAERLANMPASTLQILGAEKALFRHLRGKARPPKHGLIFQHKYISTSPKKVRGKIARAFATKVSIAAKADVYGKRFIGDGLLEAFEKRYQQIMKEYKEGKK